MLIIFNTSILIETVSDTISNNPKHFMLAMPLVPPVPLTPQGNIVTFACSESP